MEHNSNNSHNKKKNQPKIPSPFTLRHMLANKMNVCSSGKFNSMELETDTHTHEHSGLGPNSNQTHQIIHTLMLICFTIYSIFHQFSLQVLFITWSALHINHFHMKINCHFVAQQRVHYIRSSINTSWTLYSMFRCHRRSPSTEFIHKDFHYYFATRTIRINIFRMSNFPNINHFQIMRTHIHSIYEH